MHILEALAKIDKAANENRLYHYNGGQAYIRVNMQSDDLMVIDHASGIVSVEISDGSKYFDSYHDYNLIHSKHLRESGSLVDWYTTNYINIKETA